VPEAAPEMPVAKVEAPVIVWEDAVELPVEVDNIPDAEEVLEPELLAVEEEEEELEEPPAVNAVLVVQGLKWISNVLGPNIQMVSPASSQVSLNHLVAASS
jgi:hypothetical protein